MVNITSILYHGRKISGEELDYLAHLIKVRLNSYGYSSTVNKMTASSLKMVDVRLTQKMITKYGHNRRSDSGYRTSYPSWTNWGAIVHLINSLMDETDITATITSEHGLIKWREGKIVHDTEDIEEQLWNYADNKPSQERWVQYLINKIETSNDMTEHDLLQVIV